MSVDPSVDTGAGAPPSIEFDHYSPQYRDNWQQIADENLARCPVARSGTYGGFWLVSDYASVSRVIRDDATFTSTHNMDDPSDPRQGIVIPPNPMLQVPMEFDPPLYNVYRRMLNPYFSPPAARALEPFVRQAVDALLDKVCATGRMDLVLDLGNPVPALATMKLVGLPLDDWERFAEPMHGIVSHPAGGPEYLRCMNALQELGNALGALVPGLREREADGLLSGLAKATVNDQPLSDGEVVLIALLVMQGGVDTTTALLANTLWWLEEHPEQRQRLIEEPALLEHATEEFLRIFTPVPALARTVTEDVVVGGQQMCAGDRVLMSFSAANRDPEVFDDPAEARLDRFPNPHASFGLGIHRCIGSNFARSWFQIMLRGVLDRMPDYAIDRDATRRNESIGIINGFFNMPATFTPSEPRGVPMPE
ncbi:Cytochrome P450 [Micromonospora pattaloongensis]|uniref:Cytochrome P450 n=1 Tax=Micromonospora pattaloongensis TaxID=405436 RepID=A0A1H3JDI7_9ACTN|nr:cytochrome P450 [Micromonospora pattaloongensis]SDY37649.1 Cytochrome P450 [Micromonospora pattaloongensis]